MMDRLYTDEIAECGEDPQMIHSYDAVRIMNTIDAYRAALVTIRDAFAEVLSVLEDEE